MRVGVTESARQAALRADGVVTCLRICAVVTVLASATLANALFGTGSARAGTDPLSSNAAAVALSVAFVTTGLWWLQWFGPLYQAVRDAGRARFGSGRLWFWAWVLPVANVFLPLLLVADVWRAADPPGEHSPLPAAIRWWWASWVAAAIFPLVPLAFGGRPGAAVAYVVSRLLYVAAAVLAMRTVRILTERVLLLAARARAGAPVPA
jgi:hypothetical protein